LRIDTIVHNLRMGNVERVEIASYAQHLDNFLPVEFYRSLFPDTAGDVPAYGRGHLVINIRGAEILDARHPDYPLIPIEFYRHIIERTGLRPVFMGQIDANPYMDEIRRTFPAAEFVPSRGALHDFALIRRAKNIVVCVSTFSWLAAFLSHAEKIILPVTGLFSPAQFPEVDLLPLNDSRYEFHLFPINYAVPVNDYESAHRAMNGRWKQVFAADIARIRRVHPEVSVDRGKFLRRFDPDFYLRAYSDVRDAVAKGTLRSAFEHYVTEGYYQRRMPFQFDRVAYVRRHIDAALAIANGQYAHPLHHYLEVGEQAGFRPF
jgi:hypothetical protein